MVDSYSRENEVLCIVARSWLLFLHDESEWKNFWIKYCLRCWWIAPNILTAELCCKIHDFWVADYIFLDWFARCYPYMNVWLKLIMDEFVYVFDTWRKLSCGIVYVWPRTNSDTIVCMCIWFCYLELEWMIYGGKLIWCDLPTSKIYRGEGTVLVSVRIFVNKINTYRLKRW